MPSNSITRSRECESLPGLLQLIKIVTCKSTQKTFNIVIVITVAILCTSLGRPTGGVPYICMGIN